MQNNEEQALRALEDRRYIEVLEQEVDVLLDITREAEQLHQRLEDQVLANVILTSELDFARKDLDGAYEQLDELVAEVAFFTSEKERLQDEYIVLELELQKQVADNERITIIMNELNDAQDVCARATHLLSEVRALIKPHSSLFGPTVLRAIIPLLLMQEIDEAF